MHLPSRLHRIAAAFAAGAIAASLPIAPAQAAIVRAASSPTVTAYGAMAFPTRSEGILTAQLSGDASKVLRTTDGGQHWRDVARLSGAIEGLSFASGADGWLWTSVACAGPVCPTDLYRTSDGGLAWHPSAKPKGAITALDFATPEVGYAQTRAPAACAPGACDATELWRTEDGGGTWQRLLVPGLSVESVAADGARTVLAGGLECASGACTAVIRRSADAGRTWRTVLSLPGYETTGGMFDVTIHGAQAWAETPLAGGPTPHGGIGGLYRSTDGGRTWEHMSGAGGWQGAGRSAGTGFESVPVGVAKLRAFATVQAGADAEVGGLAVTVDGGRRWSREAEVSGREVMGAAWDGPKTIWVSGADVGRSGPSPFLLQVTVGDGGLVRTKPVSPVAATARRHG